MTEYRIEARPAVDADVEGAFDWYDVEEPGLGHEFLEEVRAAYQRILDGPLMYQDLRSGVRTSSDEAIPLRSTSPLNIPLSWC